MVKKSAFGKYDIYTISDGNFSVSVTNFGAAVTDISFMGKNMVLSYPDPAGYEEGTGYICASVGRYANRIGGAKFALDGIEYVLSANEGKNQLHSGPNSVDKRVWDAEILDEAVRFSILSPDGDNGFPGNLKISVTYSLGMASTLNIEFGGETDAPTVFAPTVHPYFCLGTDANVLEAKLQINADRRVEVGEGLIPTGKLLPCEGKYDFASIRKIENDLDDCFVIGNDYALTLEIEGITMEMWTDFPAIQVYTGSSLAAPFRKNSGIALEPEFYPDSPNHRNFPSTILRPGEKFQKYVQYKFFG